jgi:hypothetical protein
MITIKVVNINVIKKKKIDASKSQTFKPTTRQPTEPTNCQHPLTEGPRVTEDCIPVHVVHLPVE